MIPTVHLLSSWRAYAWIALVWFAACLAGCPLGKGGPKPPPPLTPDPNGTADSSLPTECKMGPDSDGCTLINVVPSLITFCGDVEGLKITRLSAQKLVVEFGWCPHKRDAQCKAFVFRNPASDGAVAEVRFSQEDLVTQTVRLAAAALAPSANTPCPPDRSCALVTPPTGPFDVISVRALSGIAVSAE